MNVKVKMPDLGATSSEITVLRWLVEVGQTVKRGQPLMEVETDKATMQVESIVSGVVKEFLVECNQCVEVGQAIVLVEADGAIKPSHAGAPAPAPTVPTDGRTQFPVEPASPASPREGGLFTRNRERKPSKDNDSTVEPR